MIYIKKTSVCPLCILYTVVVVYESYTQGQILLACLPDIVQCTCALNNIGEIGDKAKILLHVL